MEKRRCVELMGLQFSKLQLMAISSFDVGKSILCIYIYTIYNYIIYNIYIHDIDI